ncbi:MAG: chromate transporter [Roseiflexaceae bacterium]
MSTIPESESIEIQPRSIDHAAPGASRPSLWQLLRVWLAIGAQSFGGGNATLYLIRRAVVERRGWFADEEFARFWSICQIVPGINLLCITVLIGWRMRGPIGVALSLLGLLLPSVTITVLLSAFYTSVRDLPLVQAALHGVLPATIGMGLLMSIQMARQPLAASRREGRASLLLSCALLASGTLLFALLQPPVLAMLWVGGGLSAAAAWYRANRLARAQANTDTDKGIL